MSDEEDQVWVSVWTGPLCSDGSGSGLWMRGSYLLLLHTNVSQLRLVEASCAAAAGLSLETEPGLNLRTDPGPAEPPCSVLTQVQVLDVHLQPLKLGPGVLMLPVHLEQRNPVQAFTLGGGGPTR